MNFNSSDYQLNKEYQNRMQHKAEQSRLAEQLHDNDGKIFFTAPPQNHLASLPKLHLRATAEAAINALRRGLVRPKQVVNS